MSVTTVFDLIGKERKLCFAVLYHGCTQVHCVFLCLKVNACLSVEIGSHESCGRSLEEEKKARQFCVSWQASSVL